MKQDTDKEDTETEPRYGPWKRQQPQKRDAWIPLITLATKSTPKGTFSGMHKEEGRRT